MDVQHPRGIKRVTVLAPSTTRRGILLLILAAAYGTALLWAYNTMGEPYNAAKAQAAAIADAAIKSEREALKASGFETQVEWSADGDDAEAGEPLGLLFDTGDDEDEEGDTLDDLVNDLDDVADTDGGTVLEVSSDGTVVEDDADASAATTGGADDDAAAGAGDDDDDDEFEGAAPDAPRHVTEVTDEDTAADNDAAGVDKAGSDGLPINDIDLELYPELNPDLDLPPLPTPEEEAAARPLPSVYLPNAWASAFLFVVICCHVLFHLMCRWLKWFEAAALYGPTTSVTAGCSVLVIPQPHRGRAAICKVRWLDAAGAAIVGAGTGAGAGAGASAGAGAGFLSQQRAVFTFQRQLYEFLTAAEVSADPATAAARESGRGGAQEADDQAHTVDDGALVGLGADAGGVRPVRCPVNDQVGSYLAAKGLAAASVVGVQGVYGKNVLTIPTPKFLDLYTEQLLSPLAIFQFFCAVLWMLDEYWQYTVFTMISILMLESTTAFQRLRTLKTLHGMCTKPYNVSAYRNGAWCTLSTLDLLPGDLISLQPKVAGGKGDTAVTTKKGKGMRGKRSSATSSDAAPAAAAAPQQAAGAALDVVPCDCLILRGAAVVNEATLTGESVPQMKDAVPRAREVAQRRLDIDGKDRVHVLFSGTSLMNVAATAGTAAGGAGGAGAGDSAGAAPSLGRALPKTPDGGVLCYVLRTGFSSSQGALVQLIEFSTQTVSADSKETISALLILVVFALVAAGYVLKVGLEKGDRTTHELLLKCVIIITSVVPRHLPMQVAMAVNTALMALTKAGIFCTEPFRVPFAGKISHILFDKTGTLTTDQLVPVGVVCCTAGGEKASDADAGTAVATSPLVVGAPVRLHGLKSRPELNGARGFVVVGLDAASGRVTVRAHVPSAAGAKGAPVTTTGRFRPANVEYMSTAPRAMMPVEKALPGAAMVLGACHSLVSVPGSGLVGDPIEVAGLRGVGWHYDASTNTASPGDGSEQVEAAAKLSKRVGQLADKQGPEAQVLKKQIKELHEAAARAKVSGARSPVRSVRVVCRHHFSSALQRMSVVVQVATKSVELAAGVYCLVKGSPEKIKPLLTDGEDGEPGSGAPEWFEATYRLMAERGMRVLALAYKRAPEGVSASAAGSKPRSWAESRLRFAGFIAFECKTRADSATVVSALRESNHGVAMATGDAALTALHVAREVGIFAPQPIPEADAGTGTSVTPGVAEMAHKPALLLSVSGTGEPSERTIEWVTALHGDDGAAQQVRVPLASPGVAKLAEEYDLVVTEEALEVAAKATDGALWAEVDAVGVFARMSPHGKARVIRAMQKRKGHNVLMCGDGGNDVGALKQADVGLALLSGYGNANTTGEVGKGAAVTSNDGLILDGAATATGAGAGAGAGAGTGAGAGSRAVSSEEELNRQTEILRARSMAAAKKIKAALAAKRKEFTAKAQGEWLQEELAARQARGEATGVWGHALAVKACMARMAKELRAEQLRLNKLHGNVFDKKGNGEGQKPTDIASLLSAAQDDAGGVAMVRPGDASIAAPFTSRSPSVRSVVDLIRQGRCTLLSSLQQQQIMMLECMISAYVLSALSLEGARSSERQMMASMWFITTASIAFSYSKPVDRMHPERPLRSLFHPAVIASTLGQAAIHLGCMITAVNMATDRMGPAALKAVVEFNKRVRLGEAEALRAEQKAEASLAGDEEYDPLGDFWDMWSSPFKPNLMNTVVFLVETAQIVAVLFVNYKGRPWMKGVTENHALFFSIFACVAGVAFCAWEVSPWANKMIHLYPFPDDAFRWRVMTLVVLSLFGTFVWDRLCTMVFAPRIFRAQVAEAAKFTLADLWPILSSLGKVLAGVLLLSTGNILIIIGAVWAYRKWSASRAAAEAARLESL